MLSFALSSLFTLKRRKVLKILVVGGGGREHAVIKALKKNTSIEKIYGIISALFVFISWLYLVIKTVVSGITLNAYRLKNKNGRKRAYK